MAASQSIGDGHVIKPFDAFIERFPVFPMTNSRSEIPCCLRQRVGELLRLGIMSAVVENESAQLTISSGNQADDPLHPLNSFARIACLLCLRFYPASSKYIYITLLSGRCVSELQAGSAYFAALVSAEGALEQSFHPSQRRSTEKSSASSL